MNRFLFNKIVRHKLTENMQNAGASEVVTEALQGEALIKAFKEKILEEATEVVEATDLDEMAEEIGDLLDVIEGCTRLLNIDVQKIADVRAKKNKERGNFTELLYVKEVGLAPSHPKLSYFLERPVRYPEVTGDSNEKGAA